MSGVILYSEVKMNATIMYFLTNWDGGTLLDTYPEDIIKKVYTSFPYRPRIFERYKSKWLIYHEVNMN